MGVSSLTFFKIQSIRTVLSVGSPQHIPRVQDFIQTVCSLPQVPLFLSNYAACDADKDLPGLLTTTNCLLLSF